jgi:DNA-binding SARP family transcriptional activator
MSRDVDLTAAEASQRRLELLLLGSFGLHAGDDPSPSLATGSQRLLALLALRDRPMTRTMIAGTLWPDSSDAHASASLRSTLTRLRGEARDAVDIADIDITLSDRVIVDAREAKRLAYRLLEPDAPRLDTVHATAAIAAFSCDLLPDWADEWVRVEAAEWRQLRLHALEALADQLADDGRWPEAIDAAQAAIRGEPLRETSHAALIRVFLAGGNRTEALVHFERYRSLLREELHLDPTPQISELVVRLDRADDVDDPSATSARSAPARARDEPRRESD